MQTQQPQELSSSSGATREVVGGCLPTARVPLPTWISVGASPQGHSAGSIMNSKKWAPGWETVPCSGSVCSPDSDAGRSVWSFTIPPKERNPTDLVRLDLAKRPYHKTSPHGWKCHLELTSHRLSSAFACPPSGPSLRQDPDHGFIRAKG